MSLNTDDNGIPIAVKFYSERSKKNQIVSLDDSKPSGLNPDMITKQHLELMYGKEATKRNKSAEKLKKQLIEEIKENGVLKDEIRIKDSDKSKFQALPDINLERNVWFLSGQSGSGKSYYSANLLNIYRKMGTKKVYIITTQEDKKFGKAEYIDIDKLVKPSKNNNYEEQLAKYKKAKLKFKHQKKEMLANGADLDDVIELELDIEKMKPTKGKKVDSFELYDQKKFEKDYGNSVWLFDDYEMMAEDKLNKINFLRDHILTTGRHYHANMIICNHLTNFGNKARLIMTESHFFVLFSKGTAKSKRYFLSSYLDMDKTQVKRVLNSLNNSRSVTICPDKKYCVYEKLIYLYN